MKKSRIFGFSFLYIFLLGVLSFLSLWRVLYFDFFQDDFFILWTSLYNVPRSVDYLLHPGSLIEFYAFAHLFGLHIFWWQVAAILLKIVTALCVATFAYQLTYSKFVGYVSGIFFAVCYVGLDTIHAPLNNVPALAAIPLLLSLIYLIKALTEKTTFIKQFLLFLFLSLLLDPARIMLVFLLLPFFLFFFPKAKNKEFVKEVYRRIFIFLVIVCIPLFILWYMRFASGSQFEVFVDLFLKNPTMGIIKAKSIGNYFATIANIFTDLFYGMRLAKPHLDTAYYSRLFGLLGVTIFFIALTCLYIYRKTRKIFFIITTFFLFWMFLFFLPNFLKEPRAPMAPENHYLFLSSIGFVLLLTYLLQRVAQKWLIGLFITCFVFLNVFKANQLLFLQFPYRSAAINNKAWQTIAKTVPKTRPGDIFLFTNNWDWVNTNIIPWGDFRYLLLTKDAHFEDKPTLSIELGKVSQLVCSRSNPSIILSHIYTWQAKSPGVLVNKTQEERIYLLSLCK